MPSYKFVCPVCDFICFKQLLIKDFLKIKKEKQEMKCENCLIGVLSHRIESVSSVIEKSPEQITMENKEDIRKMVEKVKRGDSRAITDIYGDRPNPYKK